MLAKLSLPSLILLLFAMEGLEVLEGKSSAAVASPPPIIETEKGSNTQHFSCEQLSSIPPLMNVDPPASGLPNSFCANDLMGVKSAVEMTPIVSETPTLIEDEPLSPLEGTPLNQNDNQWHFKLQPYATIPVTIYGSATVRGRTVDYHLSLGETLQNLRVTASGRFEGWKGRWGFIVDGYYVSLKGISDFQRATERIPNTLNALNFLLNRNVNTQGQNLITLLSQDINKLEKVEELRQSQAVQNFKQTVTVFKETITQDAETLRQLQQDLEDFQAEINQKESQLEAVHFELQSEKTNLNEQELEQVITLNNQRTSEQINTKIETAITNLESLDGLQQQLINTKNSLEKVSQEISELREIEDSPELQQLATDVENAKAILERDIQTLEQIETFAENRDPQLFDANLSTDLQFNQGIYDFALSYHIGELPLRELPKTPSNRPYPLVWFQPIVGVRLNDINVTIQETVNLSLSSSLVNFQGTFQETLEGGRTWFEPMLGGKLGLQISDPITFWVRGDASGFGLAGETDLSWNVFFGVDWWVRRNVSLQFAYHFYSIDYQIGQGENAFGFTQNLNGPYLAATFHF